MKHTNLWNEIEDNPRDPVWDFTPDTLWFIVPGLFFLALLVLVVWN